MSFISATFVAFALCTFVIYWFIIPERFRTLLLVAASLTFYASGQPQYVLLLLGVCLLNAMVSFSLVREPNASLRVAWLAAGVGLNLGVLCVFKYTGLVASAILGKARPEVNQIFPLASLSLPLGLSFFTFHGISLIVDHYRGELLSSKSNFAKCLNETALYITFFPQLISGPITKAKNFIPQIREEKSLTNVDWGFAAKSLVLGYFFKMVVADNLNQEVAVVLPFPFFLLHSPADLLIGLIGFSGQIFADFAGYSLIALGLAELFGYRLPVNFHYPYLARSFSEFWRRWHMSLSAWLKDYLYIPLGGNRKGRLRTYLNLFAVMGLGGLWHGATLNYAAWGMAHGTALAAERFADRNVPVFLRVTSLWTIRAAGVFLLVSFAWALFRLDNFEHVWMFYERLFSWSLIAEPISFGLLINMIIYSAPVAIYHLHSLTPSGVDRALRPLQPVLYGTLVALIALDAGPRHAFIYFQF